MWRLRQTQAVGALHGTRQRGCSGHPCGDREQGDYVWFIQEKAVHWRWHEHPDTGQRSYGSSMSATGAGGSSVDRTAAATTGDTVGGSIGVQLKRGRQGGDEHA